MLHKVTDLLSDILQALGGAETGGAGTGATNAKQDTGNASLASIDTKTGIVTASALPAGASTSAAQATGNAYLAEIDGKIIAANTGAVTVAVSALPAGAATAAGQATTNASLASVDAKHLAAAVAADAIANPTLGGLLGFNTAFNGATWDRLRAGIVGVQTAFVGLMNALAMGRYNAVPPVLADGNAIVLQVDASGFLRVSEQRQAVAEDNANGVIAMTQLPLAVATYAWSSVCSVALAASLVIKASPGIVRMVWGRVDGTLATGTYYVAIFNATTQAGCNTGALLCAPIKIKHVNLTDDFFSIDLSQSGIFGTAGIVVGLSTVDFGYTSGGAFLSATGLYK